jgi:hypothetical protein
LEPAVKPANFNIKGTNAGEEEVQKERIQGGWVKPGTEGFSKHNKD